MQLTGQIQRNQSDMLKLIRDDYQQLTGQIKKLSDELREMKNNRQQQMLGVQRNQSNMNEYFLEELTMIQRNQSDMLKLFRDNYQQLTGEIKKLSDELRKMKNSRQQQMLGVQRNQSNMNEYFLEELTMIQRNQSDMLKLFRDNYQQLTGEIKKLSDELRKMKNSRQQQMLGVQRNQSNMNEYFLEELTMIQRNQSDMLKLFRDNYQQLTGEIKKLSDELRKRKNNQQQNIPPSGFQYFSQARMYYRVILESLNWEQARNKCLGLHPRSQLTVVASQAQHEAIVGYLRSLDANGITFLHYYRVLFSMQSNHYAQSVCLMCFS